MATSQQETDSSKIISNRESQPDCTVRSGSFRTVDIAPALEELRTLRTPDGGLKAWLQVVGAFFVSFNSWGIVGTFGVFQTYYESSSIFHSEPSQISWIGSTQAFLLLFIGVLSGPTFDAGYMRSLLASSLFFTPLGFMMTSISTRYWHFMLAQGVCIGVGLGAGFTPSVSIVPQYFSKRRAIALGMAATGASIGGVVYPILFREALSKLGFGWACRILGFVSALTLFVPFLLLRSRVIPAKSRSLIDMMALRNPLFMAYCLAMFLIFLGFLIPIFYIQSYAISKNAIGNDQAFYLLPVLNTGSTFGRLIPNYAVDHYGPYNVLVPLTTGSTILALCWPFIQSSSGIIVFAVLYGFFTGGMVSATAVPIISFTKDSELVGTYIGMCFFFTAFAILAGPPSAGAILTGFGNYLGPSLFGGVALLLALLLILTLRVRIAGFSLVAKV